MSERRVDPDAADRRKLNHQAVRVYQEKKWPRQWIGMCACGRGIRTNSSDAVWAFFEKEGCVSAR